MSDFSWEDCTCMYEAFLHDSCLCDVPYMKSLPKLWLLVFNEDEVVEISGASHLDVQLLSSAMSYLAAERYIASSHHTGHVCRTLHNISESFQNIWDIFLHTITHFHDQNKFLTRSVMKALSAIMYTFSEATISSLVQQLFQLCQEDILTDNNTSVCILNLLCCILNYEMSKIHDFNPNLQTSGEEQHECEESIAVVTPPFIDVHCVCCKVISVDWNDLVKKIFAIQDPQLKHENLMSLLQIWKGINDKIVANDFKDLSEFFLSPSHINDFFCNAPNIRPQALRVYVEVISQICFESTNHFLWTSDLHLANVSSTPVTFEFLKSLPIDSRPPSFCGSHIERSGDSLQPMYPKCDITTLKKIVLIVLKILAVDKKDSSSISATFHHLEQLVKGKVIYAPETAAHTWILNLFFDQDDLLIEAMYSVLGIYLNLSSDHQKCNSISTLEEELNPHKMFADFAFRLGYSHHILLEFLMSNETCILLFLTKYLKLILVDWKNFTGLCCSPMLLETSDYHHHQMISKEVIGTSIALKHTEDNDIHQKSVLVSYSSTDSEKESEDECNSSNSKKLVQPNSLDLTSNLKMIMCMFQNLRSAIKKLTVKCEFPYKAGPLIDLITQCENRYGFPND